jgi:hypothetical protein
MSESEIVDLEGKTETFLLYIHCEFVLVIQTAQF